MFTFYRQVERKRLDIGVASPLARGGLIIDEAALVAAGA